MPTAPSHTPLSPGLYIVATPIGHLKDISVRALEVLAGAHLIACEDTRVSGTLLKHYGIATPTLSYHEHNAEAMRPKLLAKLRDNEAVALISDAGTPLLSDPGYKLARAAWEAGYKVHPVPGASSITAALSAAALPTDQFHFCGFLPSKAKAKTEALQTLAAIPGTLVLLESASRLADTLEASTTILGGAREAAICRELTKMHEEIRRGTLAGLVAHYTENGPPKGEIVLLIGPDTQAKTADAGEAETMLTTLLPVLSVRDAVTAVTALTGLPHREIYTQALALKNDA